MKPITKNSWLNVAGLLLALPTAYFFTVSILKYQLGVSGPFDASYPLLQRMGIQEPLGWNINLLILLGPIAAFGLTVFQVLKIQWRFTKDEFLFHFTVKKRWFPLLIAAFSVSLLAILFLYLVGENCR